VVTELARGLSNRQIASVLDPSAHTIKFHLRNVFTKLGVRSRVQVIVNPGAAL
jgi:two-component system nitrate/nitrite response regulator NarP